MQNFVQAYCHVKGDRASDEKMQKVTARNMILMVREINAKFPDGKQHVTCYTCRINDAFYVGSTASVGEL